MQVSETKFITRVDKLKMFHPVSPASHLNQSGILQLQSIDLHVFVFDDL